MKQDATMVWWITRAAVIAGMLILVGRVAYLQLFDATYIDRSRSYAIDKIRIYPSRGLIYDRKERLLVKNTSSYDLMVNYAMLDPQMDTALFCKLLEIDRETFIKNIEKDWKDIRYSRHVPFLFLDKIEPEVFLKTREMLFRFPGFFFQSRSVRTYPFPNGAHVLGYLGEVNQQQIDSSGGNYFLGDYIGRSGLERSYEDALRGVQGIQFRLKDNMGRIVGPWQEGRQDKSPVSGKDLMTTIDMELIEYCEQLLKGKRGSIVALEPESGEILVMVSSPSYDPNLLTLAQGRSSAFRMLQNDSLKPFFDRSVMAKYPPASIFKSVVALVAMQEGLTQAKRSIYCDGGYHYKEETWGCHPHWHCHNIQAALTVSCNTYFFTLVREVLDQFGTKQLPKGLNHFNTYLEAFGLGPGIGFGLDHEKDGFLPTPEYYNKLYKKQRWISPTIMNIGIGQGEIQLTTLQMANLSAIIANRGYYYPPHLVKGYLHDTTTIRESNIRRITVPVDARHFDPIIDGLENVMIYGTAQSSWIPGIPFCGKTGTSQNPHGKDHSVFSGFAPKHNPKIAIAVYIENAGFGGDVAAPIASLVAEKYLRDSISQERRWLEEQMMNLNLN